MASLLLVLLAGCSKWLDQKPNAALAIPETMTDVQAMLDYHTRLNSNVPMLGEVCADDYYASTASLYALQLADYRHLYMFSYDSARFEFYPNPWSYGYDAVFIANSALEALDKMPEPTKGAMAWKTARGSALFYRGRSLQAILDAWALPYDSSQATSLPGIPLRLNSNFNEISERATLEQSYQQVLTDLREALPLLPGLASHPFRVGQVTVHGYLARCYLSMRRYAEAASHAKAALLLYNRLIDYNAVNINASFPFPRFNAEVVHDLQGSQPPVLQTAVAKMDTNLLKMYHPDDLRRNAFYRLQPDGSTAFKGSYLGNAGSFVGLTTPELWLTAAEATIRIGFVQDGMNYLNEFLRYRFKQGRFQPLVAGSAAEALRMVLDERRKELVFRNLRWMDIRRLNLEGAGISVKRYVGGVEYLLPAQSKKFALPIPAPVIERSRVAQNGY